MAVHPEFRHAIVATVLAARPRDGKVKRGHLLTPFLWQKVVAEGEAACDALKEAYTGLRGIGALKGADVTTHHQPLPRGFFDADRVFTHPPAANGRPIPSNTAWAILKLAKEVRDLEAEFEEVTVFVGNHG